MSKYLILGGTQKTDIDVYKHQEWNGFKKGLALELNLESGSVSTAFEYVSPPENRVESDEASILFKAGDLDSTRIFVCTQTEILIYSRANYELQKVISLPVFNDVHHVRLSKNETLLVVSTGLDILCEVSLDGECLNMWTASDFDLWDIFDENQDYRKIVSTQPHINHSNYCFLYDQNYWLTRHVDKDAICLNSGATIDIAVGGPHDGEVKNDFVYFTTVNGKIVKCPLNGKNTRSVFDLDPLNTSERSMGWCRSLHVIDEDNFLVGFSRLRPSKLDDYTRWIKRKIKKDVYKGSLPTRIVHFNRDSDQFIRDINLEPYGLNCVFSILPL